MKECQKLCLDTIDVATACASLCANKSDYVGQVSKVCAQVCRDCAEECAKFDSEVCQECAQICRECAEKCEAMAA
nr:four-helix bundle copper-binding protein [Pontibacter sp. 172403-2]